MTLLLSFVFSFPFCSFDEYVSFWGVYDVILLLQNMQLSLVSHKI